MSDSSRDTDSGNPLAGQVSIHEKQTYTAVKFRFGNRTQTPIGLQFRQPVPADDSDATLQFMAEYHGDDWSRDEDSLDFRETLDGRSTLTTVYAVTDISTDRLRESLRAATVAVLDSDGDLFGRVSGLDATVVESETDPDDPPESGESSPEDETRETDSVDSTQETQTATETTSSASLSEIAQKPSKDPDEALTEILDEDSASTAQNNDEDRDDSKSDEDRDDSESDGESRDDSDPEALPTTQADYMISEVRGRVESPSEFDWSTIREEKSTAREIIDRIRSIVGI
jgi:hypothetical protein